MPSHVTFPEGHVLLRHLLRRFPVISHGEGPYLFDTSGKRYLDAAGGALVVSLGHGNREIVSEISEQLARVAYVNGTQFTSGPMEELAQLLSDKAAPLGLDRVALLASGSEAMEAAVKFARQLWVERGQPQRTQFISRTPGYHGNTLFALSASGRPHYKKVFGPLLSPILTVSTPYGYRCPVNYTSAGADYYAKELEALIASQPAQSIAAFLFEPVSGSSTGGWSPPPGYFDKVQAICQRYGILMIADEILCGSGRTGKFFASEHFGLQPDILTLGKGLNSGYMPVSALMVKSAHLQEMKKGSGYFQHAQTYLQSPCMAATALACLKYMDRHGVLANARTVGESWRAALEQRLAEHPSVGSVTGIGMLAGVEFVTDKTTKAPFPRSAQFVEKLVVKAFDNGLTLWPNVGHANGTDGDLIVMGPALNLTPQQAEEIVDTLDRSLTELGH